MPTPWWASGHGTSCFVQGRAVALDYFRNVDEGSEGEVDGLGYG